MATSVSGSSTVNGLYSNANKISGLVSGLDTESMIEGLVDSYNMKIIGFQQSIVQQQWKQEAYRGVIDDLLAFSEKYTSYSSSSSSANIGSAAFWNSAITTSATGTNSDKVSVSGTTDSTVSIDSVLSVATSSSLVSSELSSNNPQTTDISGSAVNLGEEKEYGTLSGTMKFTYNSSTVSITFSEEDIIKSGGDLAAAINSKLSEGYIDGTPASECIEAVLNDDGSISFRDVQGSGASPYISSVSSSIGTALGITAGTAGNGEGRTIDLSDVNFNDPDGENCLWESKSNLDQIVGKTIAVNYNGSSVAIKVPSEDDIATIMSEQGLSNEADAIVYSLNSQLESQFNGVVKVSNLSTDGSLELNFDISEAAGSNNTLVVSSTVGEVLGFGANSMANYVRTTDTLGDLLGEGWSSTLSYAVADGVSGNTVSEDAAQALLAQLGDTQGFMVASGNLTQNMSTGEFTDSDGDRCIKLTGAGDDGEDLWVKVNEEGTGLKVGEQMTVNGVVVGTFDDDSTLEEVVSAVNGADAGVTLNFSTLTNNFVFTSTETGSASAIELGNDKLTEALFGSSDSDTLKTNDGTDAVVLVTVNGEQVQLVRSSNTIELEGLKVTVNGTFNNTITAADGTVTTYDNFDDLTDPDTGELMALDAGDSIGFEQTKDFDAILESIAQMVLDYNEMMSNIKSLFTEVPQYQTDGSSYKPLTDEDANSMTESAVASYEEKAKQGLLFGDSNMRSLYNSMSGIFSASGAFGMDLYNMGFSTSYGTSTSGNVVDFDPDKMREMLESNFDTVKNAFTSNTALGGSADGVAATLKSAIDKYASVTGATKGLLVDIAGSEQSALSLLDNTMQDKIDAFQKLIETWEEKLSDKVDYYTSQFTRLEVLMANANSQMEQLASVGQSQ